MNYVLLWISVLAASLLWVAMLVACFGRIRRKWVRKALYGISVLIPLMLLMSFVQAAIVWKFFLKLETNWFIYALLMLLAYVLGSMVILYRSSRIEPGLPRAAAGWPKGSLLLAWAVAMGVWYMTVANLDLAIRARCALLAVKSNALYLATLPPVVSEEQNAAPLYQKAFARLKKFPPNGIDNPPFGSHDEFDSKEPATIAFLDHHAQTIALLRQAATRPSCRFEEDLKDIDLTRVISNSSIVRSAANLLALHARESLANGQPAEAIADAQSLLQMSRDIGQRPMLVHALVGMGVDALGVHTLQMSLPAAQQVKDLAALNVDELPSFGQSFRQALRGEEYFGLMNYEALPNVQPSMTGHTLLAPQSGRGGAFYRIFFLDVDSYLNLMEQTQNWAAQPYYQIREQLSKFPEVPNRLGLMTSILAPTLKRNLETLARIEAGDAAARVLIAATRYRLEYEKLPNDLNDLTPGYLDTIPLDPFDGQPIRLTTKNGQWTLYSVGPDQTDDGGTKLNSKGKGDLPFTLRPAESND